MIVGTITDEMVVQEFQYNPGSEETEIKFSVDGIPDAENSVLLSVNKQGIVTEAFHCRKEYGVYDIVPLSYAFRNRVMTVQLGMEIRDLLDITWQTRDDS